MIRAIFFDADDTLYAWDSWKKPALRASARMMIDLGHPMSIDELASRVIEVSDEEGGESTTWIDTVYQRTLGKQPTPYELEGIIHAYRAVRDAQLRPLEGTQEVLVDLIERGLPLGILTDAEVRKQCQRLFISGLNAFFKPELIVGQVKEGVRKPDSRLFEAAQDRLNIYCKKVNPDGEPIEPEEILMVGDKCDRDIKGATHMGWYAALVLTAKTDEQKREEEKKALAYGCFVARDSIKELLKLPELPPKRYL